jgi:predicted short-subunit dehydrogenase-like oxidoreductase (DUF2520 family)
MSTLECQGSSPFPVLILGAGRLGSHFAVALPGSRALWSRSQERIQSLEFEGLAGLQLLTGALNSLDLMAFPTLLLTVPDDALETLVDQLRGLRLHPDAVVLHCSGARDASPLAGLAEVAAIGSCHPLQSFAHVIDPDRFRGSYFGLEGDSRAIARGRALAQGLGGIPLVLRPGGKLLYHTAAVVASNLFVALSGLAGSLMGAALEGESSPAEQLAPLLPLIQGTLANLERTDPVRALTGPVSRGDAGTVKRQLELLSHPTLEPSLPTNLPEIYRLLSLEALSLAERQGLLPDKALTLRRILSGPAESL